MRFCLPVLLLEVTLLGGRRGHGLPEVKGTVTYQGQPVAKGSIVFLPLDEKGPMEAIPLTDCKYCLLVAPGKKQVMIEGFRRCVREWPAPAIQGVRSSTNMISFCRKNGTTHNRSLPRWSNAASTPLTSSCR